MKLLNTWKSPAFVAPIVPGLRKYGRNLTSDMERYGETYTNPVVVPGSGYHHGVTIIMHVGSSSNNNVFQGNLFETVKRPRDEVSLEDPDRGFERPNRGGPVPELLSYIGHRGDYCSVLYRSMRHGCFCDKSRTKNFPVVKIPSF